LVESPVKKALRIDPDYFLVLIKLTCYHEEQKNVDKKGGQSLSYFKWKLFTQIGGYMKNNFRIRFNPVTKEIEIEGTEEFVKIYFGKLQAMISGAAEEKAAIKNERKPVKVAPVKADKKKPKSVKGRPQKKAMKVAKKEPGIKRVTKIDMIVGLIQGSTKGISTAELKAKTGLAESQIWNIVNRAAKAGKIRKMKRGIYGAVAAS
jgi:hypothetical protein